MRSTRTCTEQEIILMYALIVTVWAWHQFTSVTSVDLRFLLDLPRFWLIATVIAFAHETNTTKKHSDGTKYHLNEETPKKKFNIAKSSFSNTAQWIQITWNPVDLLSKITFRIPEFIFEVKTFWGFYGFINVIDPLRGVSAFFDVTLNRLENQPELMLSPIESKVPSRSISRTNLSRIIFLKSFELSQKDKVYKPPPGFTIYKLPCIRR